MTLEAGGRSMFDVTEVLIEALVGKLRKGFVRNYGNTQPDTEGGLAWAARMALENISCSDALYHDVEHTILVTLVGQEILRGKHLRCGDVSPEEWLNFIISLLCHDIGYVKGACSQDRPAERRYATANDNELVALPPGASDASLTPYHVDRGKLFIEERFHRHPLVNVEAIQHNIELTRFPVPDVEDHQNTSDYPGLIRASDLIGQLSDPHYLNKIHALYHEFEETGTNQALGFRSPADLRRDYPRFYWNSVYPYIKDALSFLSLARKGKEIVAHLYSNVFVVEHENDKGLPNPPFSYPT
jgi:hypothetical protein